MNTGSLESRLKIPRPTRKSTNHIVTRWGKQGRVSRGGDVGDVPRTGNVYKCTAPGKPCCGAISRPWDWHKWEVWLYQGQRRCTLQCWSDWTPWECSHRQFIITFSHTASREGGPEESHLQLRKTIVRKIVREKVHTSSDVHREMLEMNALGGEGMSELVCSVHTVTVLKGKMDEIVLLKWAESYKHQPFSI